MTEQVEQFTASQQPVVWCIGGVDSSGGAGVTRDAITFADLGVHACILTTQLTVQSNTLMLSKESASASALNQQWQVLAQSTPAQAIKIGAIANDEQALLLCARIQSLPTPKPFVVWDPVLRTSSGGKLSDLSYGAIEALLSTVDLVTPNIQELQWLTATQVSDHNTLFTAAGHLMDKGAHALYIKGGHARWQQNVCDTFISASHTLNFMQTRVNTGKLRGTGCMLASAITAFVVNGYDIEDALTLANAYVSEVRHKTLQGQTRSSMHNNPVAFARINGFPSNANLFPSVSFERENCECASTLCHHKANENQNAFAPLVHTKLGIYPVVDSIDWLSKLIPTGVKIIQLRVKHGSESEIREQIRQAVLLTENTDCQLFINDHWALAIELGAFGVHLGQEDIYSADLNAIQNAGLRLGVSTHGFAEIQRIKRLNPSYIALGHIFPTTTKDMPSQPQGVERLAKYVALCGNIPTVAIGGINQQRIKAVANTGVDSIAVVTAITRAGDPIAAYHELAIEAGFNSEAGGTPC